MMARSRRQVRLCSVVVIGFLTLLGQGLVDAGTPTDIGPLPPVPIPEDNPLTPEKIELGGLLFFDARLSADGSLACVSCHLPDQGWATSYAAVYCLSNEYGAAALAHTRECRVQ